ncbi:peptidylprolyl isomerase [Myroides odoratimimus]|uniref:peptidylprolyl isomerase n=1 Tax=Myroides odoratimimus TaxID=76832 RepID=UPI00103C611D|nr:peptidylprolyl isomerase [Myroides odoratimimus]MDM1398516.1 peptidylprolyl isomerase [Myroides odoratimimus]MDM1495596.1 peptidylprolyl isomerase [Myroides odoratimimus]QBK76696.1 peptidylprolyl isomerase [Myroides odoratimimus]WHT72108.1 peptidylprolyl isomerase [Myroides odoratimimus]WHU36690.1 peptidylprolyl isomerase [Myroides odoratimimus]
MKFFNKKVMVALGLALSFVGFAQGQTKQGRKIDGVVGVVGDYIILESEIDKTLIELKAQRIPTGDLSRCDLFEKLLEDKLFAHQAVQDSLEVTDAEVTSFMNEQINRMVEDVGSIDKIIQFYNKKNEEELREALFEIVKQNKLTQNMQQHIVEKVTITPEEVRQFFNEIPKDQLPTVGDEVEIAEIVIKPEISKEQKQKVIDRLNEMKKDVLENGASFFSKAVLFTDDRGSASNGGFYSITKKSPFVKEFKEVAFNMAEGEISEPFESEYGYHIIYLEKIRGQHLDLRHILLKPKPTDAALEEAKKRAENIRTKIANKEITFAAAAASESDDKDTKQNGGIMKDPRSLDPRFELNNMEDRELYFLVSNLKEGEVSQVALKNDMQKQEKYYRIVTINKKYAEHKIDFAEDYTKVRNMALNKKQGEEVNKWVSRKVNDAYINIQGEFRNCKFRNNWLKK